MATSSSQGHTVFIQKHFFNQFYWTIRPSANPQTMVSGQGMPKLRDSAGDSQGKLVKMNGVAVTGLDTSTPIPVTLN
jgi:hypothetical protein